MLKKRVEVLLDTGEIRAIIISAEKAFLLLKEDVVIHIFAFLGTVKLHRGIIFYRSRFTTLSFNFLKITTRKHINIVTFLIQHESRSTAIKFFQYLGGFLTHIEFP